MEQKTFPLEVKSVADDGTFEGYCAIFDKPDKYGEVIAKGAFTKTLKEGGSTRPMCWYHDVREPMGIVDLSADDKGLKTLGHFDLNVQLAREKHSLMKMKAIRGLSFGFNTTKDIWNGAIRTLKEIKLFEVSPCTFQVHPDALVTSVKSYNLNDLEDVIRSIEELKSDQDISNKNLKLLDGAIETLIKLLKREKPPSGTPSDVKSLLSPIVEALEIKGKPQSHLSGIIEALENSKQE